jgi:3-oxoadipate enol-lactonase
MPFANVNNAALHYSLDGEAGKPVLILSNSLGTSLDMWAPQIKRFSGPFQLLRYDTRGHGKSAVTAGPYSIAQLAQDVIALMDHLHIASAHFCGLSMGGLTGMWFGIHHPQRLNKLVLCNTAAYIGPPENWTARAKAVEETGMAPLAQAIVARWLTPAYAQQHPACAADLEAMLSTTPAAGYAAACAAIRDADLRQSVRLIGAPTLIVSGSADLPTPPADGQFLQQSIAGAEYVELPAAHLSNQEQADAFSDAVLDFLA